MKEQEQAQNNLCHPECISKEVWDNAANMAAIYFNYHFSGVLNAAPVKRAIIQLREIRNLGPDAPKDHLVEVSQLLIDACRKYMEKTAIPAEGDSAYRMDLVSDVLSFTMKEQNYQKLALDKSKNIETVNKLDEKMRSHKARIAAKEGSLERKIDKESKRLNTEKEIEEYIKTTAKYCEEYLKVLDTTRVNKITSDEYDEFHKTLEEGCKLGDNTSIKDFSDYLKKLTSVSDTYIMYHDSLLGPLTKDGRTRLRFSKEFAKWGKEIGKEIDTKAVYIPDHDEPIKDKVDRRTASVQKLEETIGINKTNASTRLNEIKEAAKKRVDERTKMVEQFRQAQANQPKQPDEPKQSLEQPKKVKLPGKIRVIFI